ncbi:RHTO0S01e09428g1_1 [Rhodotorula toruloides]|uniref:Nitrate/nitrite transporter n=1 Tax=Rhodotorula toruloides TaxID=5286 RepID=A0A061AED3_RHOTO|nr:RHTO0S01e09428g1_1 [Rhodotorula toruloides]
MVSLFCFGAPPVDPATKKALALPIINPLNRHGRIFFFAWLSFLLSFFSWYAMPPLLAATIKRDLALTDDEVANSNIVAGVTSLIVRLIAGPLCDRIGPRYVLVGTLFLSAIPCGAAGTARNATGLYFIRFFMGIAGAAFVPCQALMAAWFDKRVIGTASAFAAGWGDAGVGVTFFVMPAVFDSFLASHNQPEHIAWRLSFIVPGILLIVCGIAVLALNDDTPTGSWSTRNLDISRQSPQSVFDSASSSTTLLARPSPAYHKTPKSQQDLEKGQATVSEVRRCRSDVQDTAVASMQPNVGRHPLRDLCCIQTLMLAAAYASTFGTALVGNSILVSWYMSKFGWQQGEAGKWAALFGLLNVVARPFGGLMADVWYRTLGEQRGLHAKKFWMSALCVLGGAFALLVGLLNPNSPAILILLASLLAISIEAGNGAVYAVVPHVNPHINGLMGGITGASGNLGGIAFSVIARHSSFAKTVWITGACGVVIGLLITPIPPLPKRMRSGQ